MVLTRKSDTFFYSIKKSAFYDAKFESSQLLKQHISKYLLAYIRTSESKPLLKQPRSFTGQEQDCSQEVSFILVLKNGTIQTDSF